MLNINVMQPKVIIRPGKAKEPAYLVFSTHEEKKQYLRKEWQYCAISRDAYMIAKPKDNKTKLREFLDKRVSFAKLSGFEPHPKDSRYWFINLKKEKVLA